MINDQHFGISPSTHFMHEYWFLNNRRPEGKPSPPPQPHMFLAFSYLVVSSPDFGQGWWLAAWVRGYHGCFENDSWWLMWWVPLCPFFPPPSHFKAWISWSMLQTRASFALATSGCRRPGSHVCYFHLHGTRKAFAPSVCSSDPGALKGGFHRDCGWCHQQTWWLSRPRPTLSVLGRACGLQVGLLCQLARRLCGGDTGFLSCPDMSF